MIINLCPTGMVPTRAMSPQVPLTNAEIAREVDACVPLGVNMVHLHVRDEEGRPHYGKDRYADLIGRIRERHPDLVLCVSCSGRNFGEFEKRSEVLGLDGALRPDMASLTLSSMNFARQASVNAPDLVRRLAETMAERGIRPELEVFDLGMLNMANYLIAKGVLRPPHYVNLILGNLATAQASPAHLAALLAEMPPDAIWCVGGIGGAQLRACAMGVLHGHGVRIGLEDNLYADPERTELATNPGLVRRIVELGRLLGQTPASPSEVRERLGIAPVGPAPAAAPAP